MRLPGDQQQPALWLLACALVAIALVFLFPDSSQQDGGYHFLFARWAWKHPELFVGVWARPIFTTVYSIPALAGYQAAKLLTVLISTMTAWQTFRLARDIGLKRPQLAIPLLFVEPSFFILCADTMTEPIFALLLVIALRLHHQGRVRMGMLTASLLILARPEGFFVGVLWAIWVVTDGRDRRHWISKVPSIGLLAAGSLFWWLAALLITGDPLFILNNWPSNWPMTGTIYGTGAWWSYLIRLPEIVGPLLIPFFAVGLSTLLKRRTLREIATLFLLFFVLHTVLRKFGLLGSAGYPRYFVAVSPAISLITLAGWNRLEEASSRVPQLLRNWAAAMLLSASVLLSFAYFDGAEWIRDTRAVKEMYRWFEQSPRPVERLIWSQAYMCIVFDRDPWENVSFSGDHAQDLASLRNLPPETLIFWEERFGPKWQGLRPGDFAEAGYELIHQREFLLEGYILPRSFFGFGGPRRQVMYLFYKGRPISGQTVP